MRAIIKSALAIDELKNNLENIAQDDKKEIVEKQPSPVILEAVAKFVKAKMKDWKESNINL
jgi:hypothetical protein